MSSGQGDAKLFARVCSSQRFSVKLENHLAQPPCLGGEFSISLRALVSETTLGHHSLRSILPLQSCHGRLPRVPSDIRSPHAT
jgi:hypothetical protein